MYENVDFIKFTKNIQSLIVSFLFIRKIGIILDIDIITNGI